MAAEYVETTTTIDGVEFRFVMERFNYLTGVRYEVGSAAHKNRGRFSGAKVHRVVSTYVIGVIDAEKERAEKGRTFGKEFLANGGKPVLFSCRPACGCTSGQFAARPDVRLSAENITCAKCAA